MSGASALVYVTKKAVTAGTPTLKSVIPGRLIPGESFEVIGTNLVASPDKLPTVKVGGVVADGVQRISTADRSIDRLKATAPGAPAGDANVVVVTETGTESNEKPVTVGGMKITEVKPDPLVLRKGGQVTIVGEGFDTKHAEAFVKLGQQPLDVTSWEDKRIVADLRDDEIDAQRYPTGAGVELTVGNGGDLKVSHPVGKVETLEIEAFDPEKPKVSASAFAIVGRGFGVKPEPGEHVWLGGQALESTSWTDARIAVKLPSGTAAGEAEVRVANRDGFETTKQIELES